MKSAKEFAREHSYRIPMLDASVIYRLNVSGSGLKLYERVKNSKGNEKYKPNTALFSGALKYCLETEKTANSSPTCQALITAKSKV